MLGNWALIDGNLHVFNGQLHATGEASGFPGVVHSVMVLQGGTWNLVDQSLQRQHPDPGRTMATWLPVATSPSWASSAERPAPMWPPGERIAGAAQQRPSGPGERAARRNGTLLAGGLIFDGMNAGFGLALIAPPTRPGPCRPSQWQSPGHGQHGRERGDRLWGAQRRVYLCGNFNVFGPWWNSDGSQARALDRCHRGRGRHRVDRWSRCRCGDLYNGQVVIDLASSSRPT